MRPTSTGSSFQTYQYSPVAVEANTTFTELNLSDIVAPGVLGPGVLGDQLNAVVVAVNDSTVNSYWVQNVALMVQKSSSFEVSFGDEIWNLTTSNASFEDYTGGCPMLNYTRPGLVNFYSCGLFHTFNTKLPFTITMTMGIVSSEPNCVYLGYAFANDSGVQGSGTYDTVCIPSAQHAKVEVRHWYQEGEAEAIQNVLCGSGGFLNVQVNMIQAKMQLYYKLGDADSWIVVPHAWSVGSTGETASGITMVASGQGAIAISGPTFPYEMW
ncbi:MAG: thermopsin [Thaumarchaeota archaeon]|nr:thermopsin [Nitrososphaerota archaeon]